MTCGTRTTYLKGCRCERCRAASTAYVNARNWATGKHRPRDQMRGATGYRGTRSGRLLVTCWCESSIVSVDREDVLAGKTGSCGPDCSRIATERARQARPETDDRTQSVA